MEPEKFSARDSSIKPRNAVDLNIICRAYRLESTASGPGLTKTLHSAILSNAEWSELSESRIEKKGPDVVALVFFLAHQAA